MELNAFEISGPSDIPTYNIQHPIDIDNYIILVTK